MGPRELLYSVATLGLTAATVHYAYSLHRHFFPTAVYLYSSKVRGSPRPNSENAEKQKKKKKKTKKKKLWSC